MAISKLTYIHGMLKDLRDPKRDFEVAFAGDDIPAEASKAIEENGVLSLNGTYGDSTFGDPIEYDHLVIQHDGGETNIEFYNKGISIVMGGNEKELRIFRICALLHRRALKEHNGICTQSNQRVPRELTKSTYSPTVESFLYSRISPG